MAADQCSADSVVFEEGGVRKVSLEHLGMMQPAVISTSRPLLHPQAICGYTWPGIEYGEPPSCAYTFFEVRRNGNVERQWYY
jgi:hypothetical protein